MAETLRRTELRSMPTFASRRPRRSGKLLTWPKNVFRYTKLRSENKVRTIENSFQNIKAIDGVRVKRFSTTPLPSGALRPTTTPFVKPLVSVSQN